MPVLSVKRTHTEHPERTRSNLSARISPRGEAFPGRNAHGDGICGEPLGRLQVQNTLNPIFSGRHATTAHIHKRPRRVKDQFGSRLQSLLLKDLLNDLPAKPFPNERSIGARDEEVMRRASAQGQNEPPPTFVYDAQPQTNGTL